MMQATCSCCKLDSKIALHKRKKCVLAEFTEQKQITRSLKHFSALLLAIFCSAYSVCILPVCLAPAQLPVSLWVEVRALHFHSAFQG